MQRISHLLVIPLLGLIGFSTGTAAANPAPIPIEPIVYTTAQHSAIVAAVGAFEVAGLSLPEVEIRFWADTSGCAGHQGLHRRFSDSRPDQINICSTVTNDLIPEIQDLAWEHTLLHELAHVWVDANVGETNRAAFMGHRGLTEWGTGDWFERGAEQAAELVAWTVSGGTRNVWQFDDTDRRSMETGVAMLRG